jgi:uroporphyrinogen decarboxylase
MISARENFLRNVKFQNPEWIPSAIHINDASWDEYREEMEKVCVKFPSFFPQVKPGWRDYSTFTFAPAYRRNEPFIDSWGCVWETPRDGIEGVVTNAVLKDWNQLKNYRVPDANVQWDRGPANWDDASNSAAAARLNGYPVIGYLPHGFLFLRTTYLRGFENAMIDFALDAPEMSQLIEMLVDHNMTMVQNYLKLGVDMIYFADDLGSQTSTFISPAMFRKFIAPAYQKLMDPCHQQGVLVALHSDGRTLDILEDQVRAGVNMVNPQDLCNGIDNIASIIKGKACIQLDIDRQSVVPFGSTKDIDELIKEEVVKLGSPQGGLEFIAGIYPPTPPENVEALCKALLKYQRYWLE